LERLYHPLYIINRLLFPTYSRLENDSSALAKAVNYTYAATGFVHFGLASILAGAGPIFITVLFTDKWMPALPLIYLLLLGSIFYPMTIPNTALAYSLGWSKTVLMINLIKTVIFWVSVLVFIRVTNSFLSYAYANLISESVQMVLYLILHSKFRVINVLSGQLPSFLSGIIVTVILAVLGNFPWQQNQLYQLVVAVLLGGSLYAALTFAFSWIGIQFRMDSVFINALIAMKRTVFIRKING
jgi:O-antigen/teichoic acid export membrane protein